MSHSISWFIKPVSPPFLFWDCCIAVMVLTNWKFGLLVSSIRRASRTEHLGVDGWNRKDIIVPKPVVISSAHDAKKGRDPDPSGQEHSRWRISYAV